MVSSPQNTLGTLLLWTLLLYYSGSHGFVTNERHPKSPRVPKNTLSSNQHRITMSPLVLTGSPFVQSRTATTSISCRLELSPQEIIETGVSFDTFAPQFLWLPMIVAPQSEWTQKIMGGRNGIMAIVILALVHLGIVITAAVQEGSLDQIKIFGEVFDPSLSQLAGMEKLFQYPNFVAEEWPHVLIWDLFVGRAIWLDGLQRGVSTRVALVFCNGIGPPGFLIYVLTCLISGKGIPSLDSGTTTSGIMEQEEK